jgi:TolA-binding protein
MSSIKKIKKSIQEAKQAEAVPLPAPPQNSIEKKLADLTSGVKKPDTEVQKHLLTVIARTRPQIDNMNANIREIGKRINELQQQANELKRQSADIRSQCQMVVGAHNLALADLAETLQEKKAE